MKPAPPSLAALRALAVEILAMIDGMAAAPAQAPDRAALIRAAAAESGLAAAQLAPMLASRFYQADAPDDAVTRAARAFTACPTLREVAEALRAPAIVMLDTTQLAQRLGCTPRHARRVMREIGERRGKLWKVSEAAMSANVRKRVISALFVSAPLRMMNGE